MVILIKMFNYMKTFISLKVHTNYNTTSVICFIAIQSFSKKF